MTHLDDETLALLALGEDADPAAAEHLRGCRRCSDELGSLTATARVGRQALTDDRLARPEPRVWDAIAAELGLATPNRGEGLRRRRRVRRRITVAVGVAAAVALGVTAVGIATLAPRSSVEATATLRAFPKWTGSSGTATLERAADGRLSLEVLLDDHGVPKTDDTELWLMDPTTSHLVSLGLIDRSTERFAVPASVDTAKFSVVDVSAEPRDGNPAHSGNSIVRGTLSSRRG